MFKFIYKFYIFLYPIKNQTTRLKFNKFLFKNKEKIIYRSYNNLINYSFK